MHTRTLTAQEQSVERDKKLRTEGIYFVTEGFI